MEDAGVFLCEAVLAACAVPGDDSSREGRGVLGSPLERAWSIGTEHAQYLLQQLKEKRQYASR